MIDIRPSFFDSVTNLWKRVSSSEPMPTGMMCRKDSDGFEYALIDDVTHSLVANSHEHHAIQ